MRWRPGEEEKNPSYRGARRAGGEPVKAAPDRLNAANLSGAVGPERYAELQRRISATFTETNLPAKDLRLNMQSLNASVLELVAGSGRLGNLPVPPILGDAGRGGRRDHCRVRARHRRPGRGSSSPHRMSCSTRSRRRSTGVSKKEAPCL
jgi:hypothetical protein